MLDPSKPPSREKIGLRKSECLPHASTFRVYSEPALPCCNLTPGRPITTLTEVRRRIREPATVRSQSWKWSDYSSGMARARGESCC